MIGSTPLTAASDVTRQLMNTALASWASSNGLANTLSYDADGHMTAGASGPERVKAYL